MEIDLNLPFLEHGSKELANASHLSLNQQNHLDGKVSMFFQMKNPKKRYLEKVRLDWGKEISFSSMKNHTFNSISTSADPSRFDLNKIPEDNNEPQGIPLVLIGCMRCYLYAMVPKTKLMCPRCNDKGVINFCHEKMVKRSKMG
ncbi:hypothetical protein Ancab_001147 [Ancistrocladus abbreviatus]